MSCRISHLNRLALDLDVYKTSGEVACELNLDHSTTCAGKRRGALLFLQVSNVVFHRFATVNPFILLSATVYSPLFSAKPVLMSMSTWARGSDVYMLLGADSCILGAAAMRARLYDWRTHRQHAGNVAGSTGYDISDHCGTRKWK